MNMAETPPPWLTEAEIDDICRPLTQAAAQVRFLERLGLKVSRKASGAPLVIRSHFEAVMSPEAGAAPTKTGKCPARDALIAYLSR